MDIPQPASFYFECVLFFLALAFARKPRDAANLPAVVMGPGSIREAHTAREFVETAQVEEAARFFRALIESAD